VVVASRRHSSPPTTVHNKPTTQYPSTPGFISNHWYGRWGQVILALVALEVFDPGLVIAVLFDELQEGKFPLRLRWATSRAGTQEGDQHPDNGKACFAHTDS
ncbi:hypothetical protein, partial [Xanthomonas perforans]